METAGRIDRMRAAVEVGIALQTLISLIPGTASAPTLCQHGVTSEYVMPTSLRIVCMPSAYARAYTDAKGL